MKKILFNIIHYILIFVFVFLICNILLYISCIFNSKYIYKNVKSSYNILNKQGLIYFINKKLDLANDNYTDALIINEMYSIDNKSPFESYLKTRKNYKRGLTTSELKDITGESRSITKGDKFSKVYNPINELKQFINNNIHTSINYGRYWHGYIILYRPLLLFLNITQIRILLFLLLCILLLYFVFLINKRFGKTIAIIYGLSFILNGYFSVAYSLESSPIFLVMIMSSIILLKNIDNIKNIGIYIFIVGCLANFFDYLTVPLITLVVPMSIYILKLLEEHKNWKKCIKILILNSIIWSIGYISSWLLKWIIYDIVFSENISMIQIGFKQFFYRTQRENSISINTCFDIIIYLLKKPSIYIGVIVLIIIIGKKYLFKPHIYTKKALPFVIITTYPIVWYTIFANHTIIHFYFVYRHCLIYMLGLLLTIYEIQTDRKKHKE